jgi:hypothetical protein
MSPELPIPKNAKWQLIFWNFVMYFTHKQQAKNKQNELTYYLWEDSQIIPV